MKAIQPYLFFNGNCREAMQFYATALGTEVNLMPYGHGGQSDPDDAERIMHSAICAPDGSAIMASDVPTRQPVPEGKNFSVSIACDSREEQERIFSALSSGGTVSMPLQDTFWGAHFGMLDDRFGVRWMLSHHAQAQA